MRHFQILAFSLLVLPLLALLSACVPNVPTQKTSTRAPIQNISTPHASMPSASMPSASTPSALAKNEFTPQSDAPIALAATGNLPLRLPAPPTRLVKNDARIAPLQDKIRRAQIFAAYQQLAKIYLSLGRTEDAAKTLRAEAVQYRRKGFADAAIIREREAARYETDLRLFIERLPTASEQRVLDTRARLEPVNGAYLGAFIDRDDAIARYFLDENFQRHAHADDWTKLIGKPHASYFMYLRYGNKFPRAWFNDLKKNGAIPHIAWEPIDLKFVQDDKYLRDFAREIRRANWPVFIRFASEMNGKWTPYHGNPKLYREKFRLVNRVLHRDAPSAATIWCVNNPPLGNITAYYPGDDGCDWVGVNFYAPPFYDNNRNRPTRDDNLLSLLDPVYNRYAARKPIAICEFAAGHRSIFAGRDDTLAAQEKTSLLYGALPRLYPRVKMVDWFSMNTLRHATFGKTKSDYALGENVALRTTYLQSIAPDYYRRRADDFSDTSSTRSVEKRSVVPMPRVLQQNQSVRGILNLSVWAKTYIARPQVFLEANGRLVFASDTLGVQNISLDTQSFAGKKLILKCYLYDDRNRFIRSQTIAVNAQP